MKPKKPKHTTILTFAMYLLLYGMIFLMIFSVLPYRQNGPTAADVLHLDTVEASVNGGPWQTVTLPHEFKGLSPRTPVTLRTDILPDYDDCIYVKTIYAPARIYLDNELVYSMGQPASYPAFLLDPPEEIRLLETHGFGEKMALRVEYESPNSHSSMIVPAMMLGSSKAIIFSCASTLAAPMVLSMVQIIVGCILLFLSLFLMLIDSKGQVFFWLGLFSKFSGISFLCENNFSILCFKNDSLLYILSFVGFFSFIIPLLRFIRIAGNCRDSRVMSALEAFSSAAAIIAMALQFSGTLDFSKSLYFFHAWIPLALVITTIVLAKRAFFAHNRYSRRLFLPILILTVSALLELCNYYLHFTYRSSSIFQAGMSLFLFLICSIAGLEFKDSIELKKKAHLLEQEKNILKIQTQQQRAHSLIMADKEQALRRQRHDLRHQLAVIQELSEDNPKLQDYLSTLIQKIPRAAEYYCENIVVNAIISHYAAQCEQEGIVLSTRLVVPETGSQDTDSDLCVIFANILENAVEACQRMTSGEKHIHLSSNIQGRMLTSAMENSFDGNAKKVSGRFWSSKRDDYGIGLSSVQSIAEAAGGSTQFQPHGGMFHSFIFVQI